jgi:hypothetical protein
MAEEGKQGAQRGGSFKALQFSAGQLCGAKLTCATAGVDRLVGRM